jgi:hypothetical protein
VVDQYPYSTKKIKKKLKKTKKKLDINDQTAVYYSMIERNKKRSFMSFNSRDWKGFTFRSGPVKSEQNFSSFWDNNSNDVDVDDFLGIDTDTKKGKDLVALAGYKRAISNFVNIVTEQSIPVVFNNNDESFTDGKKVVIGANIDDKKFDVAVGLALHEGSHIKLSDFNLLKHLEHSIPQEVYELADKVNVKRYEVISTVKNLLNYIEDRRIDSFIFRTSPGYKGYYHSMYEKYFYSKNVDKGLLSSEYRTETIDSYMFRIINLHNKNRQLSALKGLKEISELIDLGSIQRGYGPVNTEQCLYIACDVMSTILMNIDPIVVNDETGNSTNQDGDSEGEGGSGDGSSDGGDTITDEELQDALDSGSVTPSENLGNDDGSDCVELTDRQKEMLKKHIEKQEKFLDGDVQKTKLNKKESKDIKAIEDSGASYETVGDKITQNYYGSTGKGTKCLVVKNLTQSLVDSNQFGCASSYNQSCYNREDSYRSYNFVEEGLRLGTMLGRKLQVRGEESSLKFTRQDSGKLDKRLINELGFGNSNVFSHTLTERFNKAYLHISIDASGSMGGSPWNKAMTSAVAMIKACDMAGNIDVVVSIRTTHGNDCGVPMIMVCYDSRTDKLQKVKSLFSALSVNGTTPEGLCFEAIQKELIPGNSNQDSYFVNYSDGQPYYSNKEIQYQGREAESHTRKMVNNMKSMGISVLSYFINDYDYDRDREAFTNMYGKDAEFINPTNMMQVAKTMNEKFLTK